jgi:hypothetical protein
MYARFRPRIRKQPKRITPTELRVETGGRGRLSPSKSIEIDLVVENAPFVSRFRIVTKYAYNGDQTPTPNMPKPQNPDDNASEASYYSYSEYTIPASEVSVNRRWYNRLDNWRQDVSPSTPKNDRHSSSPSHLNLPRTGQDEVESTVSPKESISSRPSPRIMPRMLEPPISMPLLREEPRIMNDGRMDMVRVYDAGNGIEARLHPLVMEDKPTREVSGNRLGLVPDTFDQDVTRIKLPPSQGTFYTEQQARKLHPIQDPYRLPLPTSRGSTMYTRGTQLDRDLPPLPPSQSSHLPPRPPRKPPTATPISESFYSDSQPTDQNHRYRPEGHSGDSALLRLDTILERTDKENVSRQTYRKGTPYPSVRNLDPSETSTEYAGARYDGRRSARGDSESTVEVSRRLLHDSLCSASSEFQSCCRESSNAQPKQNLQERSWTTFLPWKIFQNTRPASATRIRCLLVISRNEYPRLWKSRDDPRHPK